MARNRFVDGPVPARGGLRVSPDAGRLLCVDAGAVRRHSFVQLAHVPGYTDTVFGA
jgi:hypothetical protein